MQERGVELTLHVSSAKQHVSLMSSLLRTLQAAVRDAAQDSEEGRRLLSAQPAPALSVAIATGADSQMTLAFRFEGPAGEHIPGLNETAFGAFMSELAAALKVTPQRTLWGTPVRPLVRSAAEKERLKIFLEDLVRLGDVTVSAGSQRIVISDGRIDM
jgi:hypothetical protein